MKIKIKNISENQVMITGYPAIKAGETITVAPNEATYLLKNPNLKEEGKKTEKSFKGVTDTEKSVKL